MSPIVADLGAILVLSGAAMAHGISGQIREDPECPADQGRQAGCEIGAPQGATARYTAFEPPPNLMP
ncbi:MAG TPA: hypothetical protein VGR65_13360 [Casimicrobiaceae bacterium]|jgi:hypothetical protein|nr:hypothetical protein [Casimicrobiaceae bacterium]